VYLPDVTLPETIRAAADAREAAANGDVVVLVPPSSHLRAVSTLAAPGVRRDAVVVVATKGIEERTLKLMSMVLEETMPGLEPERLAFLSGPTFAREVAQGLPTDVVVASKGMVAARRVQDLVHSVALRTYTSADPVGVQVGGAVKNVMAIATGACDGLRSARRGARGRSAHLPRPRRGGRPGTHLHGRPVSQPHARGAGGRGCRPRGLPRGPALGGRGVLDRSGGA
ncbi:MAG: hypothetical protein E6J70_17135, partial [Deltaproteobacteria bacterium]